MKTNINLKKNSIVFLVNEKIYSKNVVYKACYTFIDRLYVLLDAAGKDKIEVTLVGKNALSEKKLNEIKGEFSNELLNVLVRENISKNNQKILEQIIGGAMGASLEEKRALSDCQCQEGTGKQEENMQDSREIEEAVAALRKELEAIDMGEDYENDALGIRNVVLEETVIEKTALREPATKKTKLKKNGKKK